MPPAPACAATAATTSPSIARTAGAAGVGSRSAKMPTTTRGLTELLDDTTVALEVKESAVFALSQQPRDAGVPALIRVARTHPSPGVRKKALFWLGQSDDPRALALFEEILTKGR